MLKIKARTCYAGNSWVILVQVKNMPSYQYGKTAYCQKFGSNSMRRITSQQATREMPFYHKIARSWTK